MLKIVFINFWIKRHKSFTTFVCFFMFLCTSDPADLSNKREGQEMFLQWWMSAVMDIFGFNFNLKTYFGPSSNPFVFRKIEINCFPVIFPVFSY